MSLYNPAAVLILCLLVQLKNPSHPSRGIPTAVNCLATLLKEPVAYKDSHLKGIPETTLFWLEGIDGLDTGLASVLESMEFYLKLRGSEACMTARVPLRTTNYCLNVAAEQEKTVTEILQPLLCVFTMDELQSAVNAHVDQVADLVESSPRSCALGSNPLKKISWLENYAKTEEAKAEDLIKAVADSGAKVIVSGAAVGEMALHFCERYKLMVLKISSKFELRRFCGTTGAVSLGSMIQANLFNEMILKFNEVLENGKSYFIRNADVKLVNKKFDNINDQIEINFRFATEVKEIEEHIPYKRTSPFGNFEDIESKSKEQKLMGTIPNTKKEKSHCFDCMCNTMKLELWGDLSDNEGETLETMVKLNPIIAVLNVMVDKYEGELKLTTSFVSVIEMNPLIEESKVLQQRLCLVISDGNEEAYATLFHAAGSIIGCPIKTLAEAL
ncbi:hypothetical protein ACS0TY_019687 [Phlomoides rotata]